MSTDIIGVNAAPGAPGQTLFQTTGSASIAASGTPALTFSGSASSAGALVPPSGKTIYITDIYVGANTATAFTVAISFNGTTIFSGFCKGDTGPIEFPGIETQPQAAGDGTHSLVLTCGVTAATTAAWYIAGYVE